MVYYGVPIKLVAEILHRLRPRAAPNCHCALDRRIDRGRDLNADVAKPFQRVCMSIGDLAESIRRLRRYLAAKAVVDRRSHGIYIGVWPLLASPQTLLGRRKARLHKHRHAMRIFLHTSCRAEVHQFQTAILHYHDVIGRDIPVNHIQNVHIIDIFQQRTQHFPEFFHSKPLFAFYQLRQRFSLEILHDDIGCVICPKEIIDIDNGLQVFQRLDRLGFFQEFITSGCIYRSTVCLCKNILPIYAPV